MCALLIFSIASCDDTNPDETQNTARDYYIDHIGVRIEVGADAMPTIIRLGQYTREVGEACGTDEMDVIYTFDSFEIETHISGGDEYIRRIKILNDAIETPEGITIGSSRDDVIKAYGKGYTEGSGGTLRYEGNSSAIEIYFGASGNVSNIYIKTK